MQPQKNSKPLQQETSQDQQNLNEINQRLNQIATTHLNMTPQQLKQLLNRDWVDRLLGCLFGAFIGDSLGSFCQFQNKAQSMKTVVQGMQMPGGGPFFLHPGQVTDDSQMALHMLTGLLYYKSKTPLNQQINTLLIAIAKQYVKWMQNIPFDIGFTCRSAICQIQAHLDSNSSSVLNVQNNQFEYQQLQKAFQRINQVNHGSLSNGFLMRLTPMVCFCALIKKFSQNDVPALQSLIKGQANLTHSNKACIEANNVYIQIINKLILRKDHGEIKKITQQCLKKYQDAKESDVIGSAIKQSLLFESGEGEKELMCTTRNAGFFKIAFYYTFYCLGYITKHCQKQSDLNKDVYKSLLKLTIQQGGDTDTNACIVGGLIGSILGFKNLPPQYVKKQLSLKLGKSQFRANQQTYEPSRGFINLIKLIKKFQ